jgi:endonuclease YncB( thermonuclease family)
MDDEYLGLKRAKMSRFARRRWRGEDEAGLGTDLSGMLKRLEDVPIPMPDQQPVSSRTLRVCAIAMLAAAAALPAIATMVEGGVGGPPMLLPGTAQLAAAPETAAPGPAGPTGVAMPGMLDRRVGSFVTAPPAPAAPAGAPGAPVFVSAPLRQDCTVRAVIDGDTVRMSCGGADEVLARLTGFDAPELSRPSCGREAALGFEARVELERLLASAAQLEVRKQGADRYHRTLAEVHVDGAPVADRMIAAGFARPYDGGVRAGWCD